MVESSDKMWSTGEGNSKPLQYSWLENPMNSMKRQKDMTLKDELSKLVGAQYVAGKEWRNSSTKHRACIPLFSYSLPAWLSHTRHLHSRPFTVFILTWSLWYTGRLAILSPFYRWRNQSLGRTGNSSEIKQLVNSRTKNQIQVCLALNLILVCMLSHSDASGFCDPIRDCSLPGSSVPGISQARILKWVAISSSRGSSQPRDWIQVSYIGSQVP